MAVFLSSLGGAAAQFFDANGTPLAGGKVYTYEAGTTTPAAVYTSSSGSTAHANPIILDSAGRVPGGEIWLTENAQYKFVLFTSTDLEMGTYDDIYGISESTDATTIAYTAPYTGAVEETVADVLAKFVSVTDFGAYTDGTHATETTEAINKALAASDWVFFPAGTYLTNGSHNIVGKTLKGAARTASIVQLNGTNTNTSLFVNSGDINTSWGAGGGFLMRDLGLRGNWDGFTDNTITNISLIGGLIKWWAGSQIHVEDCALSNSFGFGFFCYKMGYSTIRDSIINTHAKNGVHVEAPNGTEAITSSRIVDCVVNSCRGTAPTGGNGVYICNGFFFNVNSCTLEDLVSGVYIDGADNRNITVAETHIESIDTVDGACVYYQGTGLYAMLFQNVFATAPALVQTQPAFSTYNAMGNFGLDNQWSVDYLYSNGSEVTVNNATPSTTINSITLTPGTWIINAGWNAAASSGTGSPSDRQQYALNTAQSFPSFNRNDAVMLRGDCSSSANTADGTMSGSLTLTVVVSTETTYYLYGGWSSISNTLAIALWGWIKATKTGGVYQE